MPKGKRSIHMNGSVVVPLWVVELKTEEQKVPPGMEVDAELGTLNVKVWMVDVGWRVEATISTSWGKESQRG